MKRALILLGVVTTPVLGQNMVGFSPAQADRERQVEASAALRPNADSASNHSLVLSRETHVAGTEAQAKTRDYVLARMKAWGLETEARTYSVWLPHATSVRLERLTPTTREFDLREPAVPGDPTSSLAQYPTVNGYSGVGDVSAELVYVNYGLIEDYAYLDSIGVSVQGKVAIARYGRSFRGIKAREAEKHGAVGLIIYSDPKDDGFVVGDVFPEGPMRPAAGVQRGSIYNSDGDPSTPGYGSVAGAPRVAESAWSIPRIPVIPISYGNAAELLRYARGKDVPPAWQGGLAFHYHIGPGPVKARIVVRDDRRTNAMKPIYDTFGVIRGTDFPDEMVIIGGHRDGWGPGAADNISGTVSVLEAARAIAAEAKAGHPPRRTLVFATWDAEEWGLIGSTEYVEDDSLRLLSGAVAYLNQDVAAQGSSFGATGSPSMRAMLRDVLASIPDPRGGTVAAAWRAQNPTIAEPPMGDPGGGSDFAGFNNHFGIPILEWGFGGRGGVYHSQYDDRFWMEHFGDPGFRYHATAARIGAATLLRLANADVLPFDYAEFARTMKTYLPAIDRDMAAKGWQASSQSLKTMLDSMETSALRFAAARDSALKTAQPPERLRRVNGSLLMVERALTRPAGLRTRPWFRSLIYAADENNGYANMPLPSINEAIRSGDRALTLREIDDLVERFGQAKKAIDAARSALAQPGS
ncbi:MAG TPA: M20/M25/M40 family metallo-hydrolase [Gemmatimonadaceae bacterium]|jgi:N-acetylated-alpha-linked acidic dipeptidase